MIKKFLLIILGIVLAFLFLEFSFRMLSFVLDFSRQHHVKESLSDKKEITIVCIGESMTAGQYPVYLEKDLNDRGIKNVRVIDKGVDGIKSDYLMDNVVLQSIEEYKPDIIVSMMGLMDGNKTFDKIRTFPSKIVSFFYFYKVFNKSNKNKKIRKKTDINTEKPSQKETELLEKGKAYYDNKEFEKAIEIFSELEKSVNTIINRQAVHCKIDSLKLSGKKEELEHYILKKLDEDIFFNVEQAVKSAVETGSEAIIKRMFPLNNKEIFRTMVLKSLPYMGKFLVTLKNSELSDELEEVNTIISNITNKDIYLDRDEILNPFSEHAINNYKKLAKICEEKKIQLIVMQYPTLSVEPYKIFLKNFRDIIYVSNAENFNSQLRKKLYFEIFTDSFAGDFGHCTDFGNKLISENLADTLEKILK